MEYIRTPHNTNRLFLYSHEMPSDIEKCNILITILNYLSIWDCADKKVIEYTSWEFDEKVHETTIKMILKRAGCYL